MTEYQEMTVTCHTENCENAGIGIVVQAALPDCFCICGPCGIEITDKISQSAEEEVVVDELVEGEQP